MKYVEFKTPTTGGYCGGLVQIVELSDDRCHVGYKRNDDGKWQHWGTGDGGYRATVERFRLWLGGNH